MAYIHEHFAEELSRDMLASAVGIGERHLTRAFGQETGMTPTAYLTRYRLRQARDLLEKTDLTITAIAFTTGFSDGNYFTRVFHQEIGVSPSAYRRGERKQNKEI